MPPHDDDPVDDEEDAPVSGPVARDDDAHADEDEDGEGADERDADAMAAGDGEEPVSAEELHAYLNDPATRALAKRVLRRRLPPQDVEDIAHEAVTEASAARKRPVRARMRAWFLRIALNRAARHLDRERLRREHEVPMYEPLHHSEADEVSETDASGDEPEDRGDPNEPVVLPPTEDWHVEGFFIRPWLEKQVAGDAKDEETFECMMEHARTGKTYGEIARQRGMSPNQLSLRVHRLKEKYRPRWNRYRNRTLLPLLLLGGAALLVVIVLLWLQLRRPVEDIGPDPTGYPPRAPSSSTHAPPPPAPPDTLNQALPPITPPVPAPPRRPPPPRNDRSPAPDKPPLRPDLKNP